MLASQAGDNRAVAVRAAELTRTVDDITVSSLATFLRSCLALAKLEREPEQVLRDFVGIRDDMAEYAPDHLLHGPPDIYSAIAAFRLDRDDEAIAFASRVLELGLRSRFAMGLICGLILGAEHHRRIREYARAAEVLGAVQATGYTSGIMFGLADEVVESVHRALSEGAAAAAFERGAELDLVAAAEQALADLRAHR